MIEKIKREVTLTGEAKLEIVETLSSYPNPRTYGLSGGIAGAGFTIVQSEPFTLDAPVFNKIVDAYEAKGLYDKPFIFGRTVPKDTTGLASLGTFEFKNDVDATSPGVGSLVYPGQVTVKLTEPVITETKHAITTMVERHVDGPEKIWFDSLLG